MKIGLIDCELEANKKNKNNPFPNLPLMKLSAWHKSKGDSVEWYDPLFGGRYDKVYVSKVFSFTPDYEYCINAEEIVRGGAALQYLWLMERRFMTKVKTILCRKK